MDIKEDAWGDIPRITIADNETGQRLELLYGLGAGISRLVLCDPFGKTSEVVSGYATPGEAREKIGSTFKGVFLFPFPNRLAGGSYTFNGKTYAFPHNDGGGRPNALHGLLFDAEFSVTDRHVGDGEASVTLSYKADAGAFSAYPFAFQVDILHTLSVKDGYACRIRVTNPGEEALPFATGYHPYFKVTDLQKILIQLPTLRQYELDDQMIPNGTLSDFAEYATFAPLSKPLDDGFIVDQWQGRVETCIRDTVTQSTATMWQQKSASGGFGYLQVYTSTFEQSLAVEPMSAPANAFATKECLHVLAPGEHGDLSWGISLS